MSKQQPSKYFDREIIGFPRKVIFIFMGLCLLLGLILTWAFYWSVQVNTTNSQISGDGTSPVSIGAEGLPLITEFNLAAETQVLINTGTLQTPATFDVTACAEEIEVDGTLLMLEEVSWANFGQAWLLVHSNASLNSLRANGGEVFASVVRSSCGTNASQGAEHSILWVGTVKTAAADAQLILPCQCWTINTLPNGCLIRGGFMTQPMPAIAGLNLLGAQNNQSTETPATATSVADTGANADAVKIHELVIVGSGPAGYTAAVYAARAELEPIVIAGSLDAGGALMTTTEVENFPGFPSGIMGPELMNNMQEQAERFGAEIIYEDAIKVELTGKVKTIETESGAVYLAKSVILATGSAYRKLGIDGEDRLSGKGVSWCATCDGFFFKDKDIFVVGGGDSAVEEATFLTRFANSVTLLHRRDQLRASKIMARRAELDPKLKIQWNTAVESIHGEDEISGLTLRDTVSGQTTEIKADGLFEAIGHIPRSDLFVGQVELDEEGYVVCQGRTTHTNVEGVFACGDLVDHRYRQAITAAGSGCSAALDAEKYLALLNDESSIQRLREKVRAQGLMIDPNKC